MLCIDVKKLKNF